MIKNCPHASNRLYSNLNFHITQPKYLKSRKTVSRRFVYSNNIVHFKKPTFNGLFQATRKRTQYWESLANNVAPAMLRPFVRSFIGSQSSNKTVNIGAMTSIILERNVHAERNADQHFDTKVNARQVGPQILGQIPHCTEKCPGYARGVGGFRIDW